MIKLLNQLTTRRKLRSYATLTLTLTTTLLLTYDTLQTLHLYTALTSPLRRFLCTDRYYLTRPEAALMSAAPPITPLKSTPSHIELCREFLERKNILDSGLNPNFDLFTVQEDEAVCMDWSSPHGRLLEIFSSSLIAHVGGPKFRMSYKHNCQRTVGEFEEIMEDIIAKAAAESGERSVGGEDDGGDATDVDVEMGEYDRTTIQQIYPISGLVLDDEADEIAPVNIDLMTDLCKGCIHSYGNADSSGIVSDIKPHASHHCILYPGSFPERSDGRIVPLAAIIETIQDRLRQSAAEWKTNAGVVPFADETNNGAVIYLGETSSGMPFYEYTRHIPDSATSIQILASPKCVEIIMEDGSRCTQHAQDLKKHLEEMYPNAEIRFDLTASTATSYARMTTGKYLVCSPGTVDCLLPALSGEVGTYAILSETPSKASTSHWFDSLLPYADSNIVINNLSGEEFQGEVVGGGGGGGVQQDLPDGQLVTVSEEERTVTNDPIDLPASSEGGGSTTSYSSTTTTTTTTNTNTGTNSVGSFSNGGTGGTSYTPTGISGTGSGANPYITDSTFTSNSGTTTTGYNQQGGTANFGQQGVGGGITTTTTSFNTATPPNREGCTELRGRLGSWDTSTWDKDFDYDALTEHAQHMIGRSGDLNDVGPALMSGKSVGGGAGSGGSGNLAWRESAYPQCDLDMLNLEGLCQVVSALDLHRLYFVGDNLMSEQVASFWRLLGASVHEPYMPDADGNWRKMVTCPNQNGVQFEIVFTRNDRLVYGDAQVSQMMQDQGYYSNGSPFFMGQNQQQQQQLDPCACNAWMNDYLSNPARTFVVAGAGAYSPGYNNFQNDFNAFMAGVQAAQRPNDFVAFRTTPTQGYGCCACSAQYNLASGGGGGGFRHRGLVEFDMTPQEISQANNYVTSTIHDHNLSRRAEEHKKRIAPSRRATYHESMPTMKLLHVANMMEVHPHSGEGQRKLNCDNSIGGNAAHDPHDSWNHMLYSMMLDMMQQQQQGQGRQGQQGFFVPP